MKHRTNFRPDPCARCGAQVAAHEGTLQGPPWRVICQTCLPFSPRAAARVQLSLAADASSIQVLLADRLGGALWESYRSATAALVRNRRRGNDWTTTARLSDAPALIGALSALEGLDLQVDDEVQTALARAATATDAAREAGRQRAAAVETQLAAQGGALYDYQRTGIPWLAERSAALLADEMGLGKTLQALLAAPHGAPIAVVCPAVAKGVWVREAARWRPDLTPVALKGRGSWRWPAPGELIITNYDVLSEKPGAAPDGCVLVFDEAHYCKNAKAQRTKRARALAKATRAAGGTVWGLTGTPLANRPPDLWALLQLLDLSPFRHFREFAELMGGYQTSVPRRGGGRITVWEWEGTPSPEAAERLQRVMLRRLKATVLADLPARRYERIVVNQITSEARVAAARVLKQLKKAKIDLDAAAENLSSHLPDFDGFSEARRLLAESRIPALLQLIESYEDAEEPLVVFSAHRAPVLALAHREGWAAITGDTAPEERTRIEEAFQAGALRGVAGTIAAAGTAITLTRASHAVFVDRDWTVSRNRQAEDRIHRIGQKRGVLITHLVSDHPLDLLIDRLLTHKAAVEQASIDAAARGADEADDRASALARATEISADATERAQAAALAAADDAAAYDAALAALELELGERAARAEEAAWLTTVSQRAISRHITLRPSDREPTDRRASATERERWVRTALATLADLDPDRAREENDVGFNRSDGWLGHRLAQRTSGGLTDAEWQLGYAIVCKYWRQIGHPPADEIDNGPMAADCSGR
jgi:superfamily II DNA or RNA helicase